MDASSVKSYLTATLRRLLRPIVRIALRGELTYRDFADVLKLAYFDVARDDYGLNGRKTNLARVALLTGLSRKECTRLKTVCAEQAEEPQHGTAMSPIARVITGWHETPEYCTDDGQPLPLPLDGPCPSVADLLRRFGGDIPPGALIGELKRLDAVRVAEDGRLEVLKRSFIADGFSAERIRILGNMLSDLGTTIVHNVDGGAPRIARYVVADAVTAEVAEQLRTLSDERGQALLKELDRWLSSEGRQDVPDGKRKAASRVGLGLYFFQEPLDTENSVNDQTGDLS